MNLFALSGLLAGITSAAMAVLMFAKGKNQLHYLWGLFCISVAFWGFGGYKIATAQDIILADFWWRITHIGVIFIPILFTHFVYWFLNIKNKWLIILTYIVGVVFLITNFIDGLFIANMRWVFNQFYYDSPPGPFYIPFTALFFGLVIFSHIKLWQAIRVASGIKRTQIKYLFISMGVSFAGGSLSFLPVYGINFYPVFNLTIFLSPIIVGYTILKYRLMDIRFVLGRGAVYVFSLTTLVILGLILNFVNEKYFLIPTIISGPLILALTLLLFQPTLRFFEKFASKYFYYTFYSFQTVLSNLGKKLTRVLDLDELSLLIVGTLMETMKLDRIVALLREGGSGPDYSEQDAQYSGRTVRYRIQKNIGFKEENGISLVKDNFLTQYLAKTQKPLVYEELSLMIRDATQKEEKEKMEKLKENMKRIEAALCLPLLIEEKIIGLIVLGNKVSGDPYSEQDIELLTNLANQASIALQNAKLYKEVKDLSENLEKRVQEQVKDIEELSEMKSEFLKVVNHQLRTPVSIIKGMLSLIEEGAVKGEKLKDYIQKAYLSSERLTTILDDILVSQSLIGKGESVKLTPCQIEDILERKAEQLKSQAEMKNLKVIFKKPKEPLPLTLADPEMIERAVSRLIDNAILYTEKGEIEVLIRTKKEKDKDLIEILVKDQGIGLDEEDRENLFKLFWRGQRATSLHPNGSGLGLFIVKELIEAHQGKVEAQSEGRNKGLTFIITLPIITEV